MKKTLLVAIALFFAFTINAQKHIATALSVKKESISNQFTGKPTAAACDTLKYDSAVNFWTGIYYTNETGGYSLGVSNLSSNGIIIEEDANYYDVSGSDYSYITGGLAQFAFANSNKAANLSKNLVFKVYDDDGTGLPGNLLGSANVKLSEVKNEVINGYYTVEFAFSSPIAIPSNKIFYISIDHSNFSWGNGTRDSIAIIANGNDEAPAAAYQHSDVLGWQPVNQFWSADVLGNPLNVNLFLFPFVNNSITGCSTLPVSIINFKGSVNDNKALLIWSTATELNNKGFAIERSRDGKTFTQIGFVNGAGTTTQRKDYTYNDATLSDFGTTTIYYRLKQIDLDGKTNYSNVVPLSLRNILAWKLYPNPVKDKLTIELNLMADAKVSVQIITKDGRQLLNADKGTLPQGLQQLDFNVQNLASGSYFVRVKAGDKTYTQTVIKQ